MKNPFRKTEPDFVYIPVQFDLDDDGFDNEETFDVGDDVLRILKKLEDRVDQGHTSNPEDVLLAVADRYIQLLPTVRIKEEYTV